MRKIFLLILLSCFITIKSFGEQRIVALIDDVPITWNEFTERKKLYTNLDWLFDVEKKNFTDKDIIESLIYDVIMDQEQKRLNIEITKEEIDHTITSTEQNYNKKPGYILQEIKKYNIDYQSFEEKIKTEIIKHKIMHMLFREIDVSQQEIDDAILDQVYRNIYVSLDLFKSYDISNDSYTKMSQLRKTLLKNKKITENQYTSFANKIEYEAVINNLPDNLGIHVKNMEKAPSVSKVVKNNDEYYIIVLKSKNKMALSPQDNAYVINAISNKKLLLRSKSYYDKLRNRARVKILI